MREIFSAERENASKKMDAKIIANESAQMVKELIEMESRTTLQASFYKLSMKTGLEVGQIKRLYYGEWRVIPAYIWEKLKHAHRILIERALRNIELRQMAMKAELQDFDDLLRKDEERRRALLFRNSTSNL